MLEQLRRQMFQSAMTRVWPAFGLNISVAGPNSSIAATVAVRAEVAALRTGPVYYAGGAMAGR